MAARRTSATAESPTMAMGTPSEGGRSGRGKEGREKETFMCQFPGCGQAYSRMEYLKRHQRKHQDDRPFQCKDCAKAFARSDVLLRHRRRCHPTPPPVDRSTQSPPPFIRPGVPVSSSRHDPREMSPPRDRGHKRSREDDDQGHGRSRGDREYDDDNEEERRYGESSRYGRDGRPAGNGYSSYYGASNPDDHPNYSSHLMPYGSSSYHSLSDPNHLEDASVLLSMAYPGGVPSGEQRDQQRDLPEWASNPTINLIMENAVGKDGGERAVESTSRNGSASSGGRSNSNGPGANGNGGADGQASSADIDPRLQGSAGDANEGGFLNAMSWLSGMGGEGVLDKTGMTPDVTSGWTPSGASPFQLSNLFSPSAFAAVNFENGASSTENANAVAGSSADAASTPNILNILDQIAMYEVPQTTGNPNPERPILRVDHGFLMDKAGKEFDPNSPFYLPADRFAGCYQIPHWALPPLRTLSVMACRTFHTVLNHFSFVHRPTFKLIDTAACLAFAICTVGGIRTGSSTHSDGLLWTNPTGGPNPNGKAPHQKALDGPVVPDQSWESLYEENWYNCQDVDKRQEAWNVVGWHSGPIVRNEKTNMLVKSFSLAKGVLMTEYNVALLQALILYHAPNFLSEEESERVLANMFLGTIVNITRQIGFFTPDADHFQQKIQTPVEPFTPNDLDRCWRQWIQLETRRRTAYLVYMLDTISALESTIPCILASCETAYIPLPAPDTLWKAPNAQQWLKAVKKYRPITLDEAMRRMFFLPTYGSFDTMHEKADTQYYNLLNESDYGPFARTAMVITLLRGVIDIGEGKRDRGDWRDLTDLWIGCSWLKPGKKMLAQDGTDLGIITRESLRGRFRSALSKWREGWDFDSLCSSPGSAASRLGPEGISPQSSASSPQSEPEIPKETLNYCEDALPLYWLAQALLNILNNNANQPPGHNAFSGVKYGDMLKSARTFTRTGEGVPVQIRNLSGSHARSSRHPSVASGGQGQAHGHGQGQGQGYGNGQGSGSGNAGLPTPTSVPTGSSSGGPDTAASTSSFEHNGHSNHGTTAQNSNANPNADLSSLSAGLGDGTLMGVLAALGASSSDLGAQLGLNDFGAAMAGQSAAQEQGQGQEGEGQQGQQQQGGQVGGGVMPQGELAEQLGFTI
ncbi:hypothetical protein IAT38_003119 [Cryptococcus sp. DSM 104549]